MLSQLECKILSSVLHVKFGMVEGLVFESWCSPHLWNYHDQVIVSQ